MTVDAQVGVLYIIGYHPFRSNCMILLPFAALVSSSLSSFSPSPDLPAFFLPSFSFFLSFFLSPSLLTCLPASFLTCHFPSLLPSFFPHSFFSSFPPSFALSLFSSRLPYLSAFLLLFVPPCLPTPVTFLPFLPASLSLLSCFPPFLLILSLLPHLPIFC